MIAPLIPQNEFQRQQRLDIYEILDTPNEIDYDSITKIAARILNVPMCLISLVDTERQWFKSKIGLDALETGRDISFCGHAINYEDVFVVNDAIEDERFFDNPLVTDGPRIRFYAGAPLTTKDGFNIGTFCAIDDKPREISEDDKDLLKVFSKNVIALMDLNAQNKELKETLKEVKEKNETLAKELIEKENAIKKEPELNKIAKPNISTLKTDEINFYNAVNFVKSAVSNELIEKKNKIIIMNLIDNNTLIKEQKFEFALKYLFLALNDFFSNEVFTLRINQENGLNVLMVKNSYPSSWKLFQQNKSEIEVKNEISSNPNMTKALDMMKGTKITLENDSSGNNFSITIKI